MTDLRELVAVGSFCILVGFVTGFITGVLLPTPEASRLRDLEDEAVSRGHAVLEVDPKTRDVRFRWKHERH